MATNDTKLNFSKSPVVHPGIANPTSKSHISNPQEANFVNHPTQHSTGAGADSHFAGHRDASRSLKNMAGVIEARPGIIETTNIDPLKKNFVKN